MFLDFDAFDYHVLPDPCDVPDGKIEYNFDGLGMDPISLEDYKNWLESWK